MSLKAFPVSKPLRDKAGRSLKADRARALGLGCQREHRCKRAETRDSASEGAWKLRTSRRTPVNRDTIQNLEINGLKHELGEVRRLLNMVLCLVDPEDVKAALSMDRGEDKLTHEKLVAIAQRCKPPADLFDQE